MLIFGQDTAEEVFMGMSLGPNVFKPEVFGCLGFCKIFEPFGLLKHAAKITAGWWFQILGSNQGDFPVVSRSRPTPLWL